MSKFEPNPDLYAEMSKKYETLEAAEAASTDFGKAVADARKTHRIAEVICVWAVYRHDGKLQVGMTSLGDVQVHGHLAKTVMSETGKRLAEYHEAMAKAYRAHVGDDDE